MKDSGSLHYFLVIEVAYSLQGFIVSQSKYANDIITRVGLTNEQRDDSPIEMNHKLMYDDGKLLIDTTRYMEVVGSLVYITIT